MLVTSSDYEGDLGGPVLVPDPDPTTPAADADSPGVPAGSDRPSGESDFEAGAESRRGDADADADALETPIAPAGAAGLDSDEATTED
jgi:hypothetical protein